jgi:Pentapeptide repeats (8 copies)
LTDPSSIPQELQAIIPTVRVPIQPLLLEGATLYSMFRDFDRQDTIGCFHLREANLSDADLSEANLAGANLSGALPPTLRIAVSRRGVLPMSMPSPQQQLRRDKANAPERGRGTVFRSKGEGAGIIAPTRSNMLASDQPRIAV